MKTLPLKIAFRYLFARKSFNVINLISWVGMAGMALGTAALVIILSVYNGFNGIVEKSFSEVSPSLLVKAKEGKVFTPDKEIFRELFADENVVRISYTLEDMALVSYEGRQGLAHVKGTDSAEETFGKYLVDGRWNAPGGGIPYAVGGAGLARSIGLSPRFVTPFEIYYPSRTKGISNLNPSGALNSAKLRYSGSISVNADMDAELLLVPLDVMRELMEYPEEVSAVEIWANAPIGPKVEKMLGNGYLVQDRYQQNLSLERMMRMEKLAIYLILIFVVLIVAFNIYSSLKMLQIEKEQDMETLRCLGATPQMLTRIFRLEGFLVGLIGMAAGMLLGIAAVWAQSHFGIIPMPGNFIVDSYPVVLKATDLLWTALGVGAVSYIIAIFATRTSLRP